jgi:hypothetical protein
MAETGYERDEMAAQGPKSAQTWLDALKEYERSVDKWHKQCENLDKLYSKSDKADSADREYSIFWANLEVLKPAVYARPPVPVVAPRFKDGNPIAREASDVLERTLVVVSESADIDGLMRETRDEYLRYSRGSAWVRLAGQSDEVAFDWVPYCDFAHEPARAWRNVNWVARRVWMTRKAGEERFGEAFAGVPMKREKQGDGDNAEYKTSNKAAVWEIWCKSSGKVYFVAEDHADILDEQDPWLDLRGYFPCPRPVYGTTVPGSLRPVPDVVQYKDQIEEINDYTARIAALAEGLRLKGFYAAGASDLGDAIETAVKSLDNRATLVPVSSFGALGGGSLKDSIVWLPVTDVIATITALVELRRVVIEDVYQITGISDIVRGSSDAGETATAQQIKAQWGSLRIRERQQELVRFARDLIRIAGEIVAENFPPQVLAEMSQTQLPSAEAKAQAQQFMQQAAMMAQQAQATGQPAPEPPKDQIKAAQKALKLPAFEDVAAFLKNDRARGFVIEIETDSTIQPDEDADKQRRIEFVTAVGGLFQQAAPLVMQAPMLGPFALELMKFAAQAFRAGRPLEMTLDQLGEAVEGMGEMQQEPPQPDPTEQLKLKQAEMSMQAMEREAQVSAEKHGMDLEMKREELAIKREETAMKRQSMGMDLTAMRAKHEMGLSEQFNGMQMRQAEAEAAAPTDEMQMALEQLDGRIGEIEGGAMPEAGTGDFRNPMKAPRQPKPSDVLAAITEGQAMTQAAIEQSTMAMQQSLAQLAQLIAAPKQVVRDPQTGRVVGVQIAGGM